MENHKRLFVAVEMPQTVVNELKHIQSQLKKQALFSGTFVNPEHTHITVKFIGDVALDQLEAIKNILTTVQCKPMHAQLGSLDVFQKGEFVKIIFLQIVCPELASLAEQIEAVLEPWVAKEERAFVNHLTIARVKQVPDVPKLLDFLHHMKVEPLSFVFDSFVLKESELTPQGPVYTDVKRYTLL